MEIIYIVYRVDGSRWVALRAFRLESHAVDYANSLTREQTTVEEIDYDSQAF